MTEQTDLTGVKALMFDFYGTVVDMQGGLIEAITPYLESKNYTAQPAGRVVTWWRRTHFENSMIDAPSAVADTSRTGRSGAKPSTTR